MTGYTVHSGTSDQYSSGWDAIFGGQPAAKSGKKSTAKKPAAKAAVARKPAPKKSAKKGKK